jgi:hypothetical protein
LSAEVDVIFGILIVFEVGAGAARFGEDVRALRDPPIAVWYIGGPMHAFCFSEGASVPPVVKRSTPPAASPRYSFFSTTSCWPSGTCHRLSHARMYLFSALLGKNSL